MKYWEWVKITYTWQFSVIGVILFVPYFLFSKYFKLEDTFLYQILGFIGYTLLVLPIVLFLTKYLIKISLLKVVKYNLLAGVISFIIFIYVLILFNFFLK